MARGRVALTAIALSILVLTSMMAGPAVAAMEPQATTQPAVAVAIDQDLTPIEKKHRALGLTGQLEPESGKTEAAATRAERNLRNGS